MIGTEIFVLQSDAWTNYLSFKIESFHSHNPNTYFAIKLDISTNVSIAYLDETKLFKLIYTNATVYNRLGREACIVLDFAYSLGGTAPYRGSM